MFVSDLVLILITYSITVTDHIHIQGRKVGRSYWEGSWEASWEVFEK